eukprot:CAMPEP_0183295752 /NCGR_PEP_ID=MMETSP0160_2-20130417/3594_1 /TAXON_ID=2839 ORGANISM="Odontella Sinensis, Strain Grunow 1884" /NCGR_SAMPLE_ID=MMETSP0160_2 /ASSEMBLY_ACC=CAM_ASM_000250 /LENGTH=91 /DNA_ID=CAMNT_0025457283 /DNA_START=91 /DNA_END=366 /DNA_ORIENTATION=+
MLFSNAFRSAARSAISGKTRRFQSTSTTFLTATGGTFRQNWLSDSSTYPLLVCLGAACALCTGVGIHFLANNPDVRISPTKRNSIVRTWGS